MDQQQVVQLLYLLGVSAWFGGLLLLTLGLPAVFVAVRDADPTLGRFVNVELEGQHVGLLSARLHEALAEAFRPVAWLSAVSATLAVAGQWVGQVADDFAGDPTRLTLRTLLLIVAGTLLLYDALRVAPRVRQARDSAEAAVRDTVKAELLSRDLEAARSERVTVSQIMLAALLGLIVFGA